MSEPDRIGTCRFASADVRVNRGSTWITVAPRDCASVTKRNATGWFSAMLEPMIVMQSAFARSHNAMVAAPRPNVVPRLGTDDECQIFRAERALIHRAPWIPFDLDGLALLRVYELRTAHGAERTDAGADAVRLLQARTECAGLRALRRFGHRALASQLPWDRPIGDEVLDAIAQATAETFHAANSRLPESQAATPSSPLRFP